MKHLLLLFLFATAGRAQTVAGGTVSGAGTVTSFASNAVPVITTFTATSPVAPGANSTLVWAVSGSNIVTICGNTACDVGTPPIVCTSCGISGSLSSVGAFPAGLTVATNFVLKATNGNGSVTSTASVTVTPIPTATLTSCLPTPQNSNALSTVTCTYSFANSTTCTASKSPGGAITIAPCTAGTFTDNPTVTTVYQICGTGNGTTICSTTPQTVVINQVVAGAGDNTYCLASGLSTFYNNTNGTVNGTPAFTAQLEGAGLVLNGSELFRRCMNTAVSNTPSPGPIHFVTNDAQMKCALGNSVTGCIAGTAAACGDTIELQSGVIFDKIVIPFKLCPVTRWITVQSGCGFSGACALGVHDPNFPAEGQLANYCQTTGTTAPLGYPQFPCTPLTTRLAIIRSSAANQPAIKVNTTATWPFLNHDTEDWTLNSVYTSASPGPNLPAASAWRFIGIEIKTATQLIGNVVTLDGADYMIFDRVVLHGNDCIGVAFAASCAVSQGISLQGTHLAVIDSSIYDITGAQPGVGQEGHGIAAGNGPGWQGAHKIVHNFIASDTENFFYGGGQAAKLINAGSPNGTQGLAGAGWNIHGLPADLEIRRNYFMKNWQWMMVTGSPGGQQRTFVKNLGEFKTGDRILMEGNISMNNWYGVQGDQIGDAHLITPKSQSSIIPPCGGNCVQKVVTFSKYDDFGGTGGRVLAWCSNCTLALGGAGAGNFTCEQDKTITDPAVCPNIGAFTNNPGAYVKTCAVNELNGECRFYIGTTRFHVKKWSPANLGAALPAIPIAVQNSPADVIELDASEIATGFTGGGLLPIPAAPTIYTIALRGLNPFAGVWNFTARYELNAHVASGFELFSALSDNGDEAQGAHNLTFHDVLLYDGAADFYTNAKNPCCNLGQGFKLESNTALAAVVPSNVYLNHNSLFLRNWNSNHSGFMNWFDQSYDPGLQPIAQAAYFPNVTVTNNVGQGPFGLGAAKNVGTFLQYNLVFPTLGSCSPNGTAGNACQLTKALTAYSCLTHDSPCTGTYSAVVAKNLLPQNLAGSLGNDNVPDTVILTGDTAERCASGTGQVLSGTAAACDPIATANSWGDFVTTYDYKNPFFSWERSTGTLNVNVLSKYRNMGKDGANLGADVATVLQKVAGVYAAPNYPALTLLGSPLTTGTFGTVYPTTAICNGQTTTAPYLGCGASPYKVWTLTGALPTGMALDLATGLLSGTPQGGCTANYNFTISATDAARQTATQVYSLAIVNPAC